MRKSVFTRLYVVFRQKLVEMRKAAGLTQRELAARRGREHSFVARIELGERRIDIVEFFWICQACDQDPMKMLRELIKEFRELEPLSTKRKRRR